MKWLHALLPSRALRVLAAVLWGAAFFWIGLHVFLNRPSFGAAMRERLRDRLDARFERYDLGSEFYVSWSGECWLGPFTLDPREGRPTVRAQWIGARPSWTALFRGRLEAGHVDVEGLEVATDRRGERLAELARAVKGPAAGPSSRAEPGKSERGLPSLSVDGARLFLEPAAEGEEERAIGPVSLDVTPKRTEDGWTVEGRLRQPPRGVLQWKARFGKRDGLSLAVAGKELPIRPWVAAATRSVEVEDGVFGMDVALTAPADLSRVSAKVSAQLERLVLSGERVATVPVGPWKVGYVGELEFDRVTGGFEAKRSYVLLGKAGLPIPFGVQLDVLTKPTFDASFRLGPVGLQELIATLPEQLVPGESAPHLEGPIAIDLQASGPLRRPAEWGLKMKLDLTSLAERARQEPFSLREGFEYRPISAEGGGRVLWIGAKNPSFVPISQLPPIMGQAVVTSEDAGFYAHHGFDLEGLQSGLAAALEGSKLRGGSTLTQQLVKNVFLTPDRTYARKISEALIAIQVEAALPKARILELYLNLIEWGPGVYGVGEASRYYFGVDARALSPKQAVFLASIIPNPTRWGPYFRHQGLNEAWNKRLADLLDTLHERGFLSEDAYQRAADEPLRFRGEARMVKAP